MVSSKKIELSELPFVYLLDRDRLPNCAAIYFVSDSKGQIVYIGRTINLLERWKAHHRFNQFKRLNRKNRLNIIWLTCKADIETLSMLEIELINLYKPPLNWTKVVKPIRKITPAETALQQSLQQLAKFNVMIFGFDPIADQELPTIYLLYPVYGMRGCSGSIRTALKNINKKASSLKWKEYKTYPKSSGKFGFWETEHNGLRIDIAPAQGLVDFMPDSICRTLAGVELKAFSSEQLEIILEKMSEYEENTSSLGTLEDDPIPVEFVDKTKNGNNKNVTEVEFWEELEQMAEGEVRVMTRQFVYVDEVEIEICVNDNGYFVRYHLYYWIMYDKKNPNFQYQGTIPDLQAAANRLPTIKWAGYKFRFETIRFSEDDVEVESLLIPLAMFEDLMKNKEGIHNTNVIKEIQKGEYKPKPDDSARIKLFAWLQSNSISSLLQTNNS
ncbi:MAG: GIY-YIG nuclease family protein [Nostocales cyanobacterium]|nr:MAG: GIY-YIG nuclease family protein [Nostocales cyanobacterium]TAF19848.1 MAG: GIY-YIG nuclease family protein [Nostocales cyanobacterium]